MYYWNFLDEVVFFLPGKDCWGQFLPFFYDDSSFSFQIWWNFKIHLLYGWCFWVPGSFGARDSAGAIYTFRQGSQIWWGSNLGNQNFERLPSWELRKRKHIIFKNTFGRGYVSSQEGISCWLVDFDLSWENHLKTPTRRNGGRLV